MTTLDDQADDLLRRFRADEAAIDDDLRRRMWDEVAQRTASVPASVRPARPSGRTRRRVLAVAAAVLVVALAGVVVARGTGVDDRPRETARATDGSTPTLRDVAADAAGRTGPVLGDPGATYAHVVASYVLHVPGDGDASGRTETWVALDGTGRRSASQADGANPSDALFAEPGTLPLGSLRPEVAVDLPDDGHGAIAAVIVDLGAQDGEDLATAGPLVELLALPGVPASARAGALRALDVLGYTTAPGIDAGTVTLSGPAYLGAVTTAVLDLDSGLVTSRTVIESDGRTTETSWSQADLRPTTD